MTSRPGFFVSGDAIIARCPSCGYRPEHAAPTVTVKRKLSDVLFDCRVKQAMADLRRGVSAAQVREWHGGIVLRQALVEMGAES